LIDDIGEKVYSANCNDEYELMMGAYFVSKRNFDVKSNILINQDLCTIDNMQIGRHKVLLFAHSRSASMHCSEAAAIPNILLGMTQPKPLRVKSLCLINSCAKVLD